MAQIGRYAEEARCISKEQRRIERDKDNISKRFANECSNKKKTNTKKTKEKIIIILIVKGRTRCCCVFDAGSRRRSLVS